MSEICQHGTLEGAGVRCSLFKRQVSLGICGACTENSSKGIWPTIQKKEVPSLMSHRPARVVRKAMQLPSAGELPKKGCGCKGKK